MTTTSPKTTPPKRQPDRAAGSTPMPFSHDDPKRQQKILIGGIGGAALVVAGALLLIFRPWQAHEPPRLNDTPNKLAQLAGNSQFANMPFDRREMYMKMMDRKKPQLEQAYAAGQISDEDYRKAMQAAHLGKRLDEMQKYYSKPPGHEREAYLDKILSKQETKKETLDKNPTAKKEKKADTIPRDEAEEQKEIDSWPSDIRAQFMVFEQAYKERKKLFQQTHPSKKHPATAPTTAPSATVLK
jgi:hypothetical protein